MSCLSFPATSMPQAARSRRTGDARPRHAVCAASVRTTPRWPHARPSATLPACSANTRSRRIREGFRPGVGDHAQDLRDAANERVSPHSSTGGDAFAPRSRAAMRVTASGRRVEESASTSARRVRECNGSEDRRVVPQPASGCRVRARAMRRRVRRASRRASRRIRSPHPRRAACVRPPRAARCRTDACARAVGRPRRAMHNA